MSIVQKNDKKERSAESCSIFEQRLFGELKVFLENEADLAPMQSTRRGFLHAIIVTGIGASALSSVFGASETCPPDDTTSACSAPNETHLCVGLEGNKCLPPSTGNFCGPNICIDENVCGQGTNNQCNIISYNECNPNQCGVGSKNTCSLQSRNTCTQYNRCNSENTCYKNACQAINECTGPLSVNTCGTNACIAPVKNACIGRARNKCTVENRCGPPEMNTCTFAANDSCEPLTADLFPKTPSNLSLQGTGTTLDIF